MKDYGILAGAAVSGYQSSRERMRRQQEFDKESDRRKYRQDREERLNRTIDPLTIDNAELSNRRAHQEENFSLFSDLLRRSALERSDRAGERKENFSIFSDPFLRNQVQRGERSDVRQESFDRDMDPLLRREAQQQAQVGDIYHEEITRSHGAQIAYRKVNEGMAGFESSGNAAYLESLYNDESVYPDGMSVKIDKMKDGKYHMKLFDDSGRQVNEVTTTKEDLLSSSQEFFMSSPIFQDLDPLGSAGGYPGSGQGIRGGYPGSGISGVSGFSTRRVQSQSSYMQEVGSLLQGMRGDPKYQHLNQAEMIMEAHALASQRGGKDPREAISSFYQSMVETFMKPNPLTGRPQFASSQEAEEAAGQMAERFAQKYYGNGQSAGAGAGAGAGGNNASIDGIPSAHIERLKRDHSDKMRYFFDQKYGKGAAEAVLNGH